MEPTLVDGGVAIIVVLSGILAYSRGLTRELFAIGGWILAALLAFYLTPKVEPLIRELPVVGKFLGESCVLSTIAAFTLIVAGGLLVLSVFTPIFSSAVLDSVLGPVDRVLGFVFGVLRGVVLVAVAYMIYTNLSGGVEEWPPLANAESRAIFDEVSAQIAAYLPDEMPPWFAERIDALMAPCGGEIPATAPGLPEPTAPDPIQPAPGTTTEG
ncbi:CvpA family protein [Rhodobacteraceae bacterium NNCM2]|nr:CvpA family protein [Coraliihabitans acroporae]